MKKLFVLTIKIYPILQLISMFVCNFIYLIFGCCDICIILDKVFGVTIVNTMALLVCNYIFKFCVWHRGIIFTNCICGITIFLCNYFDFMGDVYYKFLFVETLCLIGLMISLIINFKLKHKIKWLQNHC